MHTENILILRRRVSLIAAGKRLLCCWLRSSATCWLRSPIYMNDCFWINRELFALADRVSRETGLCLFAKCAHINTTRTLWLVCVYCCYPKCVCWLHWVVLVDANVILQLKSIILICNYSKHTRFTTKRCFFLNFNYSRHYRSKSNLFGLERWILPSWLSLAIDTHTATLLILHSFPFPYWTHT